MKITIENFGAIKHFEFDTEKDLTLIFGKNSVGKSYAISLVYLILKTILITNEGVQRFIELIKLSEHPEADEKSFFGTAFLNSFVMSLNNSLENTFGSLSDIKNQLSKEDLKISIHNNNSVVILGLNNSKITYKTITNPQDIFYFSKVYYLPASRSGLYQGLSAFGQIFAELSKNRSFVSSQQIGIPAISEPVADYFLSLSNIEDININESFSDYINEIEQEILQGKVDFDEQSKKIYFTPSNTSLRLDLSATSSMVSEIAPVVSYLKHILAITQTKEGNQVVPILFIEEPEAHLHPETQVKLMRVFARLVKDNKIKLVITSHSNYIFNAASNLVMDNKIPADKFEAVLFKMTEEGSVAQNMATDEYGIDDDNFIDVAESLYEEKLELINKLNG